MPSRKAGCCCAALPNFPFLPPAIKDGDDEHGDDFNGHAAEAGNGHGNHNIGAAAGGGEYGEQRKDGGDRLLSIFRLRAFQHTDSTAGPNSQVRFSPPLHGHGKSVAHRAYAKDEKRQPAQ